jgi:hypothetical protein
VLKKLVEYDPYLDNTLTPDQLAKIKTDEMANVIFARQDYQLKDGVSLGLDREKYYLYLSAVDEFFEKAEKKLKASVPSLQRVDPETEQKIIATLEGERKESEEGLGLIFG